MVRLAMSRTVFSVIIVLIVLGLLYLQTGGCLTGEPVCLAMPIRKEPYRSNHLFPYFYNMLSEGSNRQMQSLLLHHRMLCLTASIVLPTNI